MLPPHRPDLPYPLPSGETLVVLGIADESRGFTSCPTCQTPNGNWRKKCRRCRRKL